MKATKFRSKKAKGGKMAKTNKAKFIDPLLERTRIIKEAARAQQLEFKRNEQLRQEFVELTKEGQKINREIAKINKRNGDNTLMFAKAIEKFAKAVDKFSK